MILGNKDPRGMPENKDRKAILGNKDHKGFPGKKVIPEHKDRKAIPENKDHKDRQGQTERVLTKQPVKTDTPGQKRILMRHWVIWGI